MTRRRPTGDEVYGRQAYRNSGYNVLNRMCAAAHMCYRFADNSLINSKNSHILKKSFYNFAIFRWGLESVFRLSPVRSPSNSTLVLRLSEVTFQYRGCLPMFPSPWRAVFPRRNDGHWLSTCLIPRTAPYFFDRGNNVFKTQTALSGASPVGQQLISERERMRRLLEPSHVGYRTRASSLFPI